MTTNQKKINALYIQLKRAKTDSEKEKIQRQIERLEHEKERHESRKIIVPSDNGGIHHVEEK